MSRTFVLGANAGFVTKHDSKGDGLMRLAGHTYSTGRSVRILVIAERPALLSIALLVRPTFAHTTVSHAYTALSHTTF